MPNSNKKPTSNKKSFDENTNKLKFLNQDRPAGACWRYGLTSEQIQQVEARDPFWAIDAMLGLDKKPN